MSKESNDNIIFRSLHHVGNWPNPFQPSSALLNGGGVKPIAQPPKHTGCSHYGGWSNVEPLTRGNPTLGGTLKKGCTLSTHSHEENHEVYIPIKLSVVF